MTEELQASPVRHRVAGWVLVGAGAASSALAGVGLALRWPGALGPFLGIAAAATLLGGADVLVPRCRVDEAGARRSALGRVGRSVGAVVVSSALVLAVFGIARLAGTGQPEPAQARRRAVATQPARTSPLEQAIDGWLSCVGREASPKSEGRFLLRCAEQEARKAGF